ncbi:hypothetical protein JB92DRAFT_3275043, partial [Gautieria morchelliformis]
NIATALSTRFEQYGRHEDLEEAISLHREALELRPAPHPDRSSSLYNMALALLTWFKIYATLVPVLLFSIGQTFVISSTWVLGITGTFLGDYFGILMYIKKMSRDSLSTS